MTIRKKRLLVAGGGISGLAAATLGIKKGYDVVISDQNSMNSDQRRELESSRITVHDGGHAIHHLDNIDLMVLSPGIPSEHLLCIEARRRNIPVISEIDFALESYSGKLIAVTGTNGKSTTVCMIGQILEKCGLDVRVGGNLGEPPSALAAKGPLSRHLVLELSSYQLEQSAAHSAEAVAFTSFSPDHLQRHGSLRNYMAAKWRIFDWVRKDGLCLLTSEVDAAARAHSMPRRKDVRWKIIAGLEADVSRASFLPPEGCAGRHNEINGEMAVLLSETVLPEHSKLDLGGKLAGFQGLPFRCEHVGTIKKNPVINDSKSTNCESTCAALAGPGPALVLLMGGKGKGESYLPILEFKNKIAALVCFGESGQSIANELSSDLCLGGRPVSAHKALADAVIEGVSLASRLNCGLLFSPGCASFDEFKNFEDRGRFFNAAVRHHLDMDR